MKTFLIIISMIGLLSCTNAEKDKKDITGQLNNQQTRQEIFQAIQNNPKLLTEFMQEMHGNQQAMMEQGNINFMNQQYMQNMMQTNPEFMQQIMDSMIGASAKDSMWTRQMINQMAQYPQMMQMMNGYMNSNGMMGGNNQSMMHSNENKQ